MLIKICFLNHFDRSVSFEVYVKYSQFAVQFTVFLFHLKVVEVMATDSKNQRDSKGRCRACDLTESAS